MITIEKADTRDYRDIQAVARVAFPATYAEILTEGQLAYMMEWMYSTESLLRQMQEEGHTYYIARDEAARRWVMYPYVRTARECSTWKKSMSCPDDKASTSDASCSNARYVPSRRCTRDRAAWS